MLTVRAIMTKPPIDVGMDATLLQIHEIMEQHRIRHILITDQGALMGVVSSIDVARQLSPRLGTLAEKNEDRDSLSMLAHRFMTRNPVTITGDTPIWVAAEMLLSRKVSCLPVISANGLLEGIITITDLMRLLARRDIIISEVVPSDNQEGNH